MSNSKSKKSSKPKQDDIKKIQDDVASFASSLGLSSTLPNSGFNDSDFRPKKTIKPPQINNPNKPMSKDVKSQKPNSKLPPKGQTKDGFNPKFDRNTKNNSFDKSKSVVHKPQFQKPSSNFPQKSMKNDVFNSKFDDSGNSFGKFKNMPKLPLVRANVLGTWYVDQLEVEEKVLGSGGERKRVEFENADEWKKLVVKNKELGERLLAQYSVDYESSRGQSGDIKMLMTTQKSGTAADKVSAFVVLIGDNPIANMRSLDALLGMVTSKVGKRHALQAFEALKELFIQSLLPDRKLKTLFQRPLNHLPETKDGYSLLLFWYWEECLKSRYERFVVALEEASKDMLRILKDKSLKIMSDLLKSKSEQERRLLTALVNKLGDPDNKAASNAVYNLGNLLSDHPNMKAVVIDEVDIFLFRPHLGMHAKYNAINFLSQFRLSHNGDGPKIAKRLMDVYFALFKVLISGTGSDLKEEKGKETKKLRTKDSKDSSESHVELDSRLLSTLLTGVNRAFPFVSGDEADEIVDIQTPMLFRLVHSQNFNVGIQALMLLDKISSKNQVVSDRFYRALYAKLLLPAALNTSKAEMFIGVLLRAMKNDVNLKRVAAFAKRVLQVALQQPPQYACGCLFLLSEVLKTRPPLWNLAIQNESIDDDLEHFEDAPDESEDQPADVAVVRESNPESNNGETSAGGELNSDSDSSEEDEAPQATSEEDVSDEDGDFVMQIVEKPQDSVFTKLGGDKVDKPKSTSQSLPGGYDPRHREPSFCNADHAGWWELTVLATHAHPSVSTMARTLLSGATIVYNGNPLNDLSLAAFLDKFMEKKPKQSTWHGGSQIEPAKKLDMNKHLIGSELLSLAEDDVAPEDLVFHKFYMNKMSSSKMPKKKKKKGTEDEEAAELYGGDGSDNEEIEKMLEGSEPPLDFEGGYDSDDLEKVVNEDDDDLVADDSDNEMEMDALSDSGEEAADADKPDFDAGGSEEDILGDDISDDDIKIGDADDGSDEELDDLPLLKKGKSKSFKKSSASPFASFEEYEHLIEGDNSGEDGADEDAKSRPRKKRKHSQKEEDGSKDETSKGSSKRKNKRKKTLN